MSLSLYRKKRSFNKTPEPEGGKAAAEKLVFVIQKHDASHLHYDFRLEMRGVLKSWAVPKGPSLDPEIKRLAMMVEDHPYDYRTFEGIIPKGQYGGGTVIVWDEGTYEPVEGATGTKKEMEKNLLSQLYKGRLKIRMHGKKVKGDFALVKAASRGDNSWLLMKLNDRFASTTDITKKEKSVVTGRTIAQVEKAEGSSNGVGKKNSKPASKAVKKKATPVTAVQKKRALKKKIEPVGRKSRFPSSLIPMFATLVDKPFDDEGWIYEIKWDGYRAVAYLREDRVEIRSRNNKVFEERFYPIRDALATLNMNAVLDGEIVVIGDKGESRFGDLQNWRSEQDGKLMYYVFDLLWYEGYSLMHLSLTERRKKLEEVMPDHPVIRVSEAFETSGLEFYEAAKKMDLEGIMAKKADSDYKPGIRTKEWLKIKTNKRQEVVIGGYTVNEGTGKQFSALLVGVYEKDKLVYCGKIGTGFSDKTQKEMMKQFKPLLTKRIPFSAEPDVNKPTRFRPNPPKAKAYWLRPKLVCEVSYTELTSEGIMRHPSFEGMRDDKKAKEVKLEKAVSR
jgi:bifunctional non-homologous end joining protein LigD